MGLFKKDECSVCGQRETGFKLLDGYMCRHCADKMKPFAPAATKISVNEVKERIKQAEENAILAGKFTPSFAVEKFAEFDDTNRIVKIKEKALLASNDVYIPYDDIIDVEVEEKGATTTTSGGLAAAAVGGVLTGGVGAIVGANIGKKKTNSKISRIDIQIRVNNKYNPQRTISPLKGETKRDGFLYNTAYKTAINPIVDKILHIIYENTNAKELKNKSQTSSSADEILKFKELLDIGAITEEEFERKKKELLNL